MPLGVRTEITSPCSRPMSARATGAVMLMRPSLMSASLSPTMAKVCFSPLAVSSMVTVAPKTTRFPDSEVGSMTSASATISSRRAIRPSLWDWASLAALYSAFSDRSPCALASSMARTMRMRSTSLRCFSSSLRLVRPFRVIGYLSGINRSRKKKGGWAEVPDLRTAATL